MKLVLHRYLILHYFICVLFALTFQLTSIVTPALAYSNNTLQEGLVRRVNTQSLPFLADHSEVYREVHPCRSSFDLFVTKLYKGVPSTTLKQCTALQVNGKIAVAFWPWVLDSVANGCGLVWPSMQLTEDEGAQQGTCIVGPPNPTDTLRGLSPCQTGFVLEKSFYDRLPYQQRQKHQKHQKRMTLISLVKCREQEGAVAWRTRHRRQHPGKCITLPLKEDNHAMHPGLGYCFGYRPGRYQEWYIRQAIKTMEQNAYAKLAEKKPKTQRDWIEMPAGFDLRLPPGDAGQAEH